jgi:hypothetical protein
MSFTTTTGTGLLGIISDRKMWATDVAYLNDSKEFQYTVDLAREHLKHLQSSVNTSSERELVTEWQGVLNAVTRVPVYVASFSENADQLSQWRAYGRGSGYAVGFTPQVLMKAGLQCPHPVAWLKCVYDVKEQLGYLSYATQLLLKKYSRGPIPAPPDDVSYRMGFTVDFFGHLLVLAGCFKHSAFREESEWRLIVRQRTREAVVKGRRFRDTGRTLAPFLEIPLELPEQGLRIDQVIVGPTPHMEIAVAAVKALLDQRGVTHDGVEPSRIPYRDW